MATAEADPHPLEPFPGAAADPIDDPRPTAPAGAPGPHPAVDGPATGSTAVTVPAGAEAPGAVPTTGPSADPPAAEPAPTGVPRPGPGGAWTEERYLALPLADRVERRVELLDGSLLVAPGTDDRHARAVEAVRAAVAAALPDGLEVTGPVALRLAPGRILVPDLVVAARAGAVDDGAEADRAEGDGAVRDSAVALVVVDVVGRANGVADRWFKPQLYAGSRIPYALLLDHDESFAVGSMLIGGRYHEYAHAGAGEVLRLEEPFALDLDLAGLVGPAGGADGTGPAPDAAAGPDPGRDDDLDDDRDGPADAVPSARPPT